MTVDLDRFRSTMARLPGGVAVVATRWRDADHAATVSAVLSASLEPPIVVVSLHADSRIRDALDQVDGWAVSILADDQAPIADWLASPGRPVIGQLGRVPHHRAPESGAAWVDGAAAWVDCRTPRSSPPVTTTWCSGTWSRSGKDGRTPVGWFICDDACTRSAEMAQFAQS